MYKEGRLEAFHLEAWKEVWDSGRIDIFGNSHLASSAYSSLYYILSAMPVKEEVTWPFIGLSPGDLAHGAEGRVCSKLILAVPFNPLPDMSILGSSNSAANKNMMLKIWTNEV